jgi:transposase
MAKRSRVELFEHVRKVHEREDVSIRELARRFRVHRRTVRDALASAVPIGPGTWPARWEAATATSSSSLR